MVQCSTPTSKTRSYYFRAVGRKKKKKNETNHVQHITGQMTFPVVKHIHLVGNELTGLKPQD